MKFVQVQVFSRETGSKQLVGAVEIVGPGNKRTESDATLFVTNTLSLIHDRIGVAVVDLLAPPCRSLHCRILDEMADIDHGTANVEDAPRFLSFYAGLPPARSTSGTTRSALASRCRTWRSR